MAEKKTRITGAPEPAPAAPPDDDLDILAPDRKFRAEGEDITVRELTFGEQLAHAELLNRLAEALRAPIGQNDIAAIVDALLAENDALMALASICTGRPRDWIEALPAHIGEDLIVTWWAANQHFFVRRLVTYPQISKGIRDGATSLPPSSATATASTH
jgi:hypothetical protein